MTFSFHPEAEAELFAAIEYYEECEPGLGQAFAAEVTSTILRILRLSRGVACSRRRGTALPYQPLPSRHRVQR